MSSLHELRDELERVKHWPPARATLHRASASWKPQGASFGAPLEDLAELSKAEVAARVARSSIKLASKSEEIERFALKLHFRKGPDGSEPPAPVVIFWAIDPADAHGLAQDPHGLALVTGGSLGALEKPAELKALEAELAGAGAAGTPMERLALGFLGQLAGASMFHARWAVEQALKDSAATRTALVDQTARLAKALVAKEREIERLRVEKRELEEALEAEGDDEEESGRDSTGELVEFVTAHGPLVLSGLLEKYFPGARVVHDPSVMALLQEIDSRPELREALTARARGAAAELVQRAKRGEPIAARAHAGANGAAEKPKE